MIEVLAEHRPQEVYNLAAQSFVQTSFSQPVLTGDVTALGVTRLLDAIRIVDPDIRFYQASSSRDVRQGRRGAPDRADAALPPIALRRGQGLRPLDHGQLPGELRPPRQLGHPLQPRVPPPGPRVRDRKISHGVARIKLGLDTELRLGNLDAQRDWGFAADYVEAMWRMLQQDEPGDYVVATGETHSVREFCELAFGHVGLDWTDYVRQDERFFRPAEVDLLVGDPAKARDASAGRCAPPSPTWCAMMVDADLELLDRRAAWAASGRV